MRLYNFFRLLSITAFILSLSTSCGKTRPDDPNLSPEPGTITPSPSPGEDSNSDESKVDPSTGLEVKTITFDVSAYDTFVYFSFKNGLVYISDEQSKDLLNWDMAFHRADIRTNSGESSAIGAKGGAYETPATVLSEKVDIPAADKFETDIPYVIAVSHTDEAGVRQAYRPVSPVLTTKTVPVLDKDGNPVRGANGFIKYNIIRRGAIVMDLSQMPPVMELSRKVYLIRTPDGQYAKVKITKYSRKPNTPMGDPGRLLRMDYVYPIK
ncbi:HmuY family protein [Porphyromonas sp.]|uniref:HmuY family protein n=1 Tax=Porphyromonas sp. TaxID=1924944 RepID=UPI0026DAAD27|nr:HmuY family protein [Porphyromonas sp.]MDO4771667.1 HmuY family protein [Porphyromonas sp.]